MRMEKPMIPGSSDKVEINEVPFRMKLGPSNFMEVSKVIKWYDAPAEYALQP